MNAIDNFKGIAAELVQAGPTEKAKCFADKIAKQVEAKGDEWIVENADKLGIQLSADFIRQSADVSSNRLWFLTKWQSALRAA